MKWHIALTLFAALVLSTSVCVQGGAKRVRVENADGSESRSPSPRPNKVSDRQKLSGDFLDKLTQVSSFQDMFKTFNIKSQVSLKHLQVKTVSGIPRIMVDTRNEVIYCKTRQRCVDIPQPQDGSGVHWPFCALVPQCDGCCHLMSSLLMCKPIKESVQAVDVMFLSHQFMSGSQDASGLYAPRWKKVLVTAHEKCACKCRVSASSCKQNQNFVEKHCRCECKPETKAVLPCKSGFKWNDDICGCKCAHPIASCPMEQEWSTVACGCVCKRKSCDSDDKELNEKCMCVYKAFNAFKNFPGNFGK